MKKRLLALLCFVIISAMLLCACDLLKKDPDGEDNAPDTNNESGGGGNDSGDDGADDCEHTYSETWLSNANQHWHPANCEHTDLKADLGNHVDADENSACDVCGRNVPHAHTYGEEWLFDDEYHWHAATCSHTDEKGSYERHADTDSNHDGICDVCKNEFDVVIEDTKEALFTQIINSRTGVSASNIHIWSEFISLGKDGIATSDSFAEYKFGTNSMYVRVDTEAYHSVNEPENQYATSYYEKWQEYVTAEEVFGIFSENGSALALDATASLDTIKGHYFSVSTLADAYSPEEILYLLYQLSQHNTADSFVWTEENGEYSFSYGYMQINTDVGEGEAPNVNYYEVSVTFKHNKNYVLTDLEIICECYSNSLQDEVDNDYYYNETTGEIEWKPEGEYAPDTYVFTVTQTAGDRTYVNENPRNKFLPDTFETFTDKELTKPTGDTIDASTNTRDPYRIYIGAFLPEGTNISFFPELFGATFSDGENTYVSTIVGVQNEKLYLAHNAIDQDLVIRFYAPGVYTLTISIGNANTKTIVFNVQEGTGGNVGQVLVEELEVEVKGRESWTTKGEGDTLDVVSFTATVSGNYTFKIPTIDSGAYDKIAYDNTFGTENAIGAFIDPFKMMGGDYNGGEFTVYIEAGMTYEFYVASWETQTIQIQCYLDN